MDKKVKTEEDEFSSTTLVYCKPVVVGDEDEE